MDNLNQNTANSRPAPPYQGGFQIKGPLLEWYLSKRIKEWVPFGGEKGSEKVQYQF
jgi:hypothetical protein